ncbi:MAG TPA: ABC transporter permease [Vicinamibacterales bacterium]
MQSLAQDIRYGIRLLIKTPAFTAVAILVLALGIGANTAVFSLINAMILQPIPSDGPAIVGIYNRDTTRPDSYRSFSYDEYRQLARGTSVFESVMAHTVSMVGIADGDNTRQSMVSIVSGNYFSTLGTSLAAGRSFTADEERPGADVPVTVLSYHAARKVADTPEAAVGQRVRVNAREYTVVGVAPEGFAGTMALVSPELWLPLGVYERGADDFKESTSSLSDPRTHPLMLVGRLRSELNAKSATPMLGTLTAELNAIDPDGNAKHALMVQKLPRLSVNTNPSSDSGPSTLSALLMGMAALVLLVACLNLANMLLARGTARRKEIALRLALGGGRGRIVRQLLTESLLIALAGGAAGLLLALWGTRLHTGTLVAVLPKSFTFDGTPDVRVLIATFVFSAASTIVAGLGPAWRVTRPDVLPDLKEQASEASGGRLRMRHALVVGQVALSLALVTAAGLFMRGAVKAGATDPGFPLEGLLARVSPTLAGYDEARGRAALRMMLDRVRSTPGVQSASAASIVPFGEFHEGRLVQRGGTPPAPEGQREQGVNAEFTIVGSDYFDTLRVPVLRGRAFTRAEENAAGGPPVAVVDEALARQLFKDEDPIGQMVQFSKGDTRVPRTFQVVGVVGGVREDMFEKVPNPHLYLPMGQNYRGTTNLHVRLAGGAAAESAMLATIRQELRAVDAAVPVLSLKTLRQHRDDSISLWAVNTGARLFSVFGGVALVLALIGLYGVKSYLVSRRTREIGIRMALGATTRDVLWLVLREGIVLTLAGVGIGLFLAWGLGRLLSGMLYDVSPLDPIVFSVAPLLLMVSATLASLVPARRAARVVPLSALRTD